MAAITLAYFSPDLANDAEGFGRRFFGIALRAPNLRWTHVAAAGLDDPVFGRLLDRGIRITSASGTSAEPIAHSVIGGVLMLARGFPAWQRAQRDHAWRPLEGEALPADLRGQTMTVLGLGAIGTAVARIARVLGLRVIGVRRRPPGADAPIDEYAAPDALPSVLPRTDWLVIAVPLTDETRRLIDRRALALLPRGAHVVNVARGAIVDEGAMIDALRDGALGGAYLDVFETEPLPPESPLWDLPNVIVSPHDSGASRGYDARSLARFLENLERWSRETPLTKKVREP